MNVGPLKIAPGRAEISEDGVWVQHDTPEFLAVEIDMRTKYCEAWVLWESGRAEIDLVAGDEALWPDKTKSGPTVIQLPDHTKDWSVMASCARYTARIVAWKIPEMADD